MSNQGFILVSNCFFDECMREVSGSAFKVICAIARKTIGWHKTEDIVSLSQLQEATSLSRKTVLAAIQEAIAGGWITQRAAGNSFAYGLSGLLASVKNGASRCAAQKSASVKNTPKSVEKVDRFVVEKLHTQKNNINTKNNSVVLLKNQECPQDTRKQEELCSKQKSSEEGAATEVEEVIEKNLGQEGLSLWRKVYAKNLIVQWILCGRLSANVVLYAVAFGLAKGKNPAIVFNMIKAAPSEAIPPWSDAIELDTGLPLWKRFIWSAFNQSEPSMAEEAFVIY